MIPTTTLRLFEDEASETVGQPNFQSFWIGRLLEEGETVDLRWLVKQVGEEAIKNWFDERGARQLSSRSRAFWSVVLGVDAPSPSVASEALWLL